MRRLCWDWTPTENPAAAIAAFLSDAGARQWQRDLTVPVLAKALAEEPTEP